MFAACNVLLLPGGILAAGGGFFFGLWWGFLLVFSGNVIATTISFALSRGVANRWVWHKISSHKILRALQPAVEREGWKLILLSQLHPLFPTSLLNYLYGLTTIRFVSYLLWASIGRVPGLFLYVYVGTLGQYGLRIVRGVHHPKVIDYWTWGGAFVITLVLLILLARVIEPAVRKAEAANGSETQNRQDIPYTSQLK